MSKMRRILKTQREKTRNSPTNRLARITELKREIKFWKDVIVPDRKKRAKQCEHEAIWSRCEFIAAERQLNTWKKELESLLKRPTDGK